MAIERRVDGGAFGLASPGWTRSQADALAIRFDTLGFSSTVAEHSDGNRGPALSIVAVAPDG